MDLATALTATEIKAVSLDIFDTCLTRLVAQPADVFTETGAELAANNILEISSSRFCRLRKNAEVLAREERADHEPNVEEIYEALGKLTGWNEAKLNSIRMAEVAMECALLTSNPVLAKAVDTARNAGKRIVFTTDMYLPRETLKGVLSDKGFLKEGDLLLISCEQRKSKYTGALFGELIKQLKLAPGEIIHVGDNQHSDVHMAAKAGLRTFHVKEASLTQIEQAPLPFSRAMNRIPSLMAGASRIARLRGAVQDQNGALHQIGCSILGPIQTAFCLWNLNRASRAGLKRLYFVARDGQVSLDVMRRLQELHPWLPQIECRYLHGSRISWHQSVLHHFTDRQLRWLLNPQPLINTKTLADRIGIAAERLKTLLEKCVGAELAGRAKWHDRELEVIADALRQNETEILADKAVAERRETAKEYFRQEGLMDADMPWGLVELGWSGSMLSSLIECLGKKDKLHAFYLCHAGDDRYLPPTVDIESFLSPPEGASEHFARGLRMAEMLEALCAADHGTVLGFERAERSITPRLKQQARNIWLPPDLAALRKGAKDYVEALGHDAIRRINRLLDEEQGTALLAQTKLVLLTEFMRNPGKELARPFLRCDFSEDPADENRRSFASPLSLGEARQRRRKDPEGELWMQGSLEVSPPFIKDVYTSGLPRALARKAAALMR